MTGLFTIDWSYRKAPDAHSPAILVSVQFVTRYYSLYA